MAKLSGGVIIVYVIIIIIINVVGIILGVTVEV